MGSGRTGAQQRASVIGRSPTPSISTGDRFEDAEARDGRAETSFGRGDVLAAGAAGAAGVLAAAAASMRLKYARSFDLLREETRKPALADNQSRLGAACLPVMISTTSPLDSGWVSGAMRPFTLDRK